MRSIKPTTIRLDDEDVRLVEIIKRKYGQSSLIGVIRTALRIAANELTPEKTPEETVKRGVKTDKPRSKGK